MDIAKEIQKRRTFAIISHPDAGKTTLTEKLLLYGGAVQLAGSVTARKNQRATTSDWMELERKRGISISSTVLQFDYDGYRINLLDTPGHKDFSEDTYRVLTAVDAVVMVIDAAKASRRRPASSSKCARRRGVPIFTFMNKCDRPTREPLALLDELEGVLGIGAFPVNWPLGTGFEFQGVYDRQCQAGLSSSSARRRALPRPGVHRRPLRPGHARALDDATFHKVIEELEMLEIAGESFDLESVLAGKTTPVFFGSAMNNFGVQLLLDGFLNHSPPPKARVMAGTVISPGKPSVLRLHLQDPGQHGPQAPRPHRLHARLLGEIRARHGGRSIRGPARRSACPARTSSSARSARPWTRRIPATSSAWSAMPILASATP